MNISLVSKKAMIGGSSRGIGRAIAQQLAASGASVTVMARSEDKLDALVSSLPTNNGQKHQYLVVDYSNFEAYKKLLPHFLKQTL